MLAVTLGTFEGDQERSFGHKSLSQLFLLGAANQALIVSRRQVLYVLHSPEEQVQLDYQKILAEHEIVPFVQ